MLMGMTILVLAYIAFLFKFSDIQKWWLWFSVFIVVLVQGGYKLGMFGLIVAIAISKVLKDLCQTGSRS